MRVFDIRPIDVEITTIFTLTEMRHLHYVLESAIIRDDFYEDKEALTTYKGFLELIETLIKETEDGD